MINPKLKNGDRVILLHMEGETSIPPGTLGTVMSHSVVFGDDQYSVKWDSGSSLALISSSDLWDTEENRKQSIEGRKKSIGEHRVIKKRILEGEGEYERNKNLIKNIDVFKHFNMQFLNKFLRLLRDSSVVNMMGAAPYLYMGKERMEHEHHYDENINQDDFEEVLELADKAQSEMINGVLNVLESEGVEESVENINRYLRKYSQKVLFNYINLF